MHHQPGEQLGWVEGLAASLLRPLVAVAGKPRLRRRLCPTLDGDLLYAFGATGILNALDPADGSVVWSRDVAADAEMEVPDWGFASSPLVVEDVAIVAAAGQLMAYDSATGSPRWSSEPNEVGHRRALGNTSPEALFQRPCRPRGQRLRLRRPYSHLGRSHERREELEGRTLR